MKKMKVTKYIAAIIFAAACSVTLAQDEYYFPTISKVTFKIKETYTVPDLKAKDSDGNKIPGTARVYNNYYTQLTKEGFVNVEEFGTKTRTFKISNKIKVNCLKFEGQYQNNWKNFKAKIIKEIYIRD